MNESRTDRILRGLTRAGRKPSALDSTKAGYGFETRVMATIRARAATEDSPWLLWHRLMWRAVPVAAVVALIVCVTLSVRTNGEGDSLPMLTDPLGLELALSDYLGGSL